MKLNIGDQAPEFEATNQNGEQIKLSNFKGQKVVLYFYPKDNTPTCTQQACNLKENYNDLLKAGLKVFGVSVDNAKSHLKFIAKYELPFDLLIDEEHKLVDLYGVWQQKKLYGREYMGTVRTTFIIDENGTISNIIDKVVAKDHTAQILK